MTRTPSGEQQVDTARKTLEHIRKVQMHMADVMVNLQNRMLAHDLSKLRPDELAGFARLNSRLETIEYGTKAYQAALDEAEDAVSLHYQRNRHHPQYHENGVADMTLLDLLEMLADWYAASQYTKDGSLRRSLDVNKVRFNIPPLLARMLDQTALELGWLDDY